MHGVRPFPKICCYSWKLFSKDGAVAQWLSVLRSSANIFSVDPVPVLNRLVGGQLGAPWCAEQKTSSAFISFSMIAVANNRLRYRNSV
jgi:hypothetical protein